MTETTSLTDMLQMARVCEGMVHSEELSKQYLESVKSVKQIDTIHHHERNNSKNRHKGKGRAHGIGSHSHHRLQSQKPGQNSCNNCGTSHPPRKCKAYGKECFHCHKQGHFSKYCCSKQHGRSPSASLRNSSHNHT